MRLFKKFISKTILFFLISLAIRTAGAESNIVLSLKTPSPEINYEEFKSKILLDRKTNSIAKTLHMLPLSYRSNYTLMHTSGSIQPGTYLNPRALLFGETASLIISFNGDKSQEGYNALEIANYDDTKRRIFYRKVIFREDSGPNFEWTKEAIIKNERLDENIEDAVEYFDERILISKPNQMICMGCHSAKTFSYDEIRSKRPEDRFVRYNWAAYDTWNGAYGKTEDILSDDQEFQKFLINRKTNLRYQALFRPQSDNSFPYSDTDEVNFNRAPNSRLTMLLALRYAQQLANVIYTSGVLHKNYVKYMLSLGCEEDNNNSVLKEIATKHGRLSLEFPPIQSYDENYTLPFPVLDTGRNELNELVFIQLAMLTKKSNPKIYSLLTAPMRPHIKTANNLTPLPINMSWNSNFRVLDLVTKNLWNFVPLYETLKTQKYTIDFRTPVCNELRRRL